METWPTTTLPSPTDRIPSGQRRRRACRPLPPRPHHSPGSPPRCGHAHRPPAAQCERAGSLRNNTAGGVEAGWGGVEEGVSIRTQGCQFTCACVCEREPLGLGRRSPFPPLWLPIARERSCRLACARIRVWPIGKAAPPLYQLSRASRLLRAACKACARARRRRARASAGVHLLWQLMLA